MLLYHVIKCHSYAVISGRHKGTEAKLCYSTSKEFGTEVEQLNTTPMEVEPMPTIWSVQKHTI